MAIVLADPAACMHRRTINSQYAEVGVRATPTHARASSTRQPMKASRLPALSENVPQIMGATPIHEKAKHGRMLADTYRHLERLCIL